MCTLGYGTCFFCQLVQLGRELKRLALEYRHHIKNLNILIGKGKIRVSQVDPVPVISTGELSMFGGKNYIGLLNSAQNIKNALQFTEGASYILSHDVDSFINNITLRPAIVFFVAQLFSETARGHEELVIQLLVELQERGKILKSLQPKETIITSPPTETVFVDERKRVKQPVSIGEKRRTRSSGTYDMITYCGREIAQIHTGFPYMQSGGAWRKDPVIKKTRTVTTRDLFVYGVILRNLDYEIRQIRDRAVTFLRNLTGITLYLGDMGPLITCCGDAYPYEPSRRAKYYLLKANPELTNSALTRGMDMIIENDGVLMLLAAICISERVRGYEDQVAKWVNTVRAGDGTSLPRASFMKSKKNK